MFQDFPDLQILSSTWGLPSPAPPVADPLNCDPHPNRNIQSADGEVPRGEIVTDVDKTYKDHGDPDPDRYVTDDEFVAVRGCAHVMVRIAMNILLITAARQKERKRAITKALKLKKIETPFTFHLSARSRSPMPIRGRMHASALGTLMPRSLSASIGAGPSSPPSRILGIWSG
jgi:hypothetical protein